MERMKQEILNTISDLVTDFLYYDRKEDEDLSVEDLKKAFKDGVITTDECIEHFSMVLKNSINL